MKRKKIIRPGVPMLVPDAVNPRWSMNIVSGQLAYGRRYRVLNVVDDFSQEYVLKVADFSISGARVARALNRNARKLPKTIVCDNGPELTSKALYFWSRKAGVKLHFNQPEKPTQNAFVENFNGKLREYYLNMHWFAGIEDARSTINHWQNYYNHVRPHRSLGKKPPAVFAKEAA
jgi:putative transposase